MLWRSMDSYIRYILCIFAYKFIPYGAAPRFFAALPTTHEYDIGATVRSHSLIGYGTAKLSGAVAFY